MSRSSGFSRGSVSPSVNFSTSVTIRTPPVPVMRTVMKPIVITFCLLNHGHYLKIKRQLHAADEALSWMEYPDVPNPPPLEPSKPTAVFVVGSSQSGGVYALQWVRRELPEHFKNFVFMNVRTVDSQCYSGAVEMEKVRQQAGVALSYFVNFCHHNGLPSKSYLVLGTDPIEELTKLAEKVREDFPNSIFFTSKLILDHDNWYIRQLHSEAALQMLRRLHLRNMAMVILPMKL